MSDQEDSTASDPRWNEFLDEDWLNRVSEEILDPDLPIIDPHHHIWWNHPLNVEYRIDDFVRDVNSGHRVVASVFMETAVMYRAAGPEQMKVVGETEFIRGLAAMSASGGYGPLGLFAGIVGACDLTENFYPEVLRAHIEAGGGRFKGVRVNAQCDADDLTKWGDPSSPPPHFLLDERLQAAVSSLAGFGLVCDLMCFHTQLEEAAFLADAAPDTRIVMNHVGGPLGVGSWNDRVAEVKEVWRKGLRTLSERPNVWLKMGGLANPFFFGIMYRDRPSPPTSQELASAYRPWFDEVVDIFGPNRVMFESNFPADRVTVSYQVVWNAFKILSSELAKSERKALLGGTAAHFYGLSELLE